MFPSRKANRRKIWNSAGGSKVLPQLDFSLSVCSVPQQGIQPKGGCLTTRQPFGSTKKAGFFSENGRFFVLKGGCLSRFHSCCVLRQPLPFGGGIAGQTAWKLAVFLLQSLSKYGKIGKAGRAYRSFAFPGSTKAWGGDDMNRMTDHEMLMVVIAIITLVLMAITLGIQIK